MSKPIHMPKGSMCMACANRQGDCTMLDFSSMPVLLRHPEHTIVKCTGFITPAARSNVTAMPIKSRLELEHNTTPKQLQDLVRPLFLWMHDHGIDKVAIDRDGPLANVTINGTPV